MTTGAGQLNWRYEIDPAYSPDGEVPPHAIKRAAQVDEQGEVVGDWLANENYQPSFLAQLLDRDPSDDFLQTFGAYMRGELTLTIFKELFAAHEFAVLANTSKDSILLVDSEGTPAYSLYSTEFFVPEGTPTVAVKGAYLLASHVSGAGFLINSGEQGALWLPAEDLLQ